MGWKEKEKHCQKGPLQGEGEGGSTIHQCRGGAGGVWAQRHGSLVDEGERDSRIRKIRIHAFEFCSKPVLKMSQITSLDSLGLFFFF